MNCPSVQKMVWKDDEPTPGEKVDCVKKEAMVVQRQMVDVLRMGSKMLEAKLIAPRRRKVVARRAKHPHPNTKATIKNFFTNYLENDNLIGCFQCVF